MKHILLLVGILLIGFTALGGNAAEGSAAAQNPTRSFGKNKTFDQNDPQGLVVMSYHYSTGEESSPKAFFAQLDPETGDYLEEFSFLLGSGLGLGRARYLRKQGYDFVKSPTHFVTRRFDPGIYVLVAAERGFGRFLNAADAYQNMSRVTFAFTVEAGKVNYLGDFTWGIRSRTLCSLSRGEYDRDPTAYKNKDEGLCYAKFRNEDNANKRAREQAGDNPSTDDQAEITTEPKSNSGRIVYARASTWGLADYNRIYGQSAEKRIGLMRSYLDKYRPKVSKTVEIIVSDRVDVTLERNVAAQIYDAKNAHNEVEDNTQNENAGGENSKGGEKRSESNQPVLQKDDQPQTPSRPSHLDTPRRPANSSGDNNQ